MTVYIVGHNLCLDENTSTRYVHFSCWIVIKFRTGDLSCSVSWYIDLVNTLRFPLIIIMENLQIELEPSVAILICTSMGQTDRDCYECELCRGLCLGDAKGGFTMCEQLVKNRKISRCCVPALLFKS